MTTLLLIRHGCTDALGHTISGRSPGVHLSAEGRRQAQALPGRLAGHRIEGILSSPMERARETAEPLAAKLGRQVHIAEALNEMDFGDWTGQTIAALKGLESWRQWNQFRSGLRIPNGEMMTEVQARMVREMEALCRQFPDGTLALFSHGDPIRSALAHYLGMPLEFVTRLEVSPASLTILTLAPWGAQVRGVNLLD